MLTATGAPKDLSRAFRALPDAFRRQGAVEVTTTVGFPGGNMPVIALWVPTQGIWLASKKLDQRPKYHKYWNALGVQDPRGQRQVQITIEVNFRFEGPSRGSGGVGKDPGGQLYLTHNGNTGGKRRVPAQKFWEGYDGPVDTLKSGQGKPRPVACFPLDSPLLVEHLTQFTKKMALLKGQTDAAPAIHTKEQYRSVELSAEEVLPDEYLFEGAVHQVTVNAYERNQHGRSECLKHYGRSCMACGLNFETAYGKAHAGYIHVHHVKPLAKIRAAYRLDPIRDLRPVCPNCHAIIHRHEPPFSIDEVAEMIRIAKGSGRKAASATSGSRL